MDSKCGICGKHNEDDHLTQDGYCFDCDLQESGFSLITEENMRELFNRLDEIVERTPAGSPNIILDSLN